MPKSDNTTLYYEDIFNTNGASYHAAMELVPKARDTEFNTVLSLIALKAGDNLLDVPAGGGYLKKYCPNNIHYHGYDFSTGFGHNGVEVNKCTETTIPVDDHSIDHIVCLAAMHHVEDRIGFYNEAKRILKPNGNLVIADAILGSQQDYFLNTFVDHYTKLGHRGDFMQIEREQNDLNSIGFNTNFNDIHYAWRFDSPEQARSYCRLLFTLNKNPTDSQIDEQLEKLGTKKTSSQFLISWRLGFITAKLV